MITLLKLDSRPEFSLQEFHQHQSTIKLIQLTIILFVSLLNIFNYFFKKTNNEINLYFNFGHNFSGLWRGQ